MSVASINDTTTTDGCPGFGHATGLKCRECGALTPFGPVYACAECFGPLEVAYDFPTLSHADIETGPPSLWRYAPLLPVPADVASRPGLSPGFTRLGTR